MALAHGKWVVTQEFGGQTTPVPLMDLPPGRLRDDDTAMEDDGLSDAGSDSDVGPGAQAVIMTPGDYCARLESNATGGSVLGVLHAVLGIMGDLWEDGYNELVGTLTSEFRDVDESDLTVAQSMTFAVLRRYSCPTSRVGTWPSLPIGGAGLSWPSGA